MLPILRMIPAGGVLLAIAILVLALLPRPGPHAHFAPDIMPTRGALLAREQHPGWRQLLILAALRRVGELRKLRDLADTPTRTAPVARSEDMQNNRAPTSASPDREIAGVPQPDTVGNDITGTVQAPDADIPVEIGETSSAELPVIPHKEMPPVITMPALQPPDANVPAPDELAPPRAKAALEQSSKQAEPAERAREIGSKPAARKPQSLNLPIPPVDLIRIVTASSESKKPRLVIVPRAPKLALQNAKMALAPLASKPANGKSHAKPAKPKPDIVNTAAALPQSKEVSVNAVPPPAKPKPESRPEETSVPQAAPSKVTSLDLASTATQARAEAPSAVPMPPARPPIHHEQKKESRAPTPGEPMKSERSDKPKLASREPASVRIKPKRERPDAHRRVQRQHATHVARRTRRGRGEQAMQFPPFSWFGPCCRAPGSSRHRSDTRRGRPQ